MTPGEEYEHHDNCISQHFRTSDCSCEEEKMSDQAADPLLQHDVGKGSEADRSHDDDVTVTQSHADALIKPDKTDNEPDLPPTPGEGATSPTGRGHESDLSLPCGHAHRYLVRYGSGYECSRCHDPEQQAAGCHPLPRRDAGKGSVVPRSVVKRLEITHPEPDLSSTCYCGADGCYDREVADLRRRADYLNRQYNTAASALQTIAGMPTEPRPDGTYNYSREALIDIAKRAQARIMEEAQNG